MTILCLLCAIAAFAFFGLATDYHYLRRLGTRLRPERRRLLRGLAWTGVGLCLALAFSAAGAVYGAILWLGALSFGAAATFLFLNLAPAGAHAAPRSTK